MNRPILILLPRHLTQSLPGYFYYGQSGSWLFNAIIVSCVVYLISIVYSFALDINICCVEMFFFVGK